MQQREIKFRVWDKKVEQLLGPENWLAVELSGAIDEITSDWHYYRVKEDRYILMQFIGLKDKNGKEIYEGDIIKPLGNNPKCWVIQWSKRFSGFEIGENGNPLFEKWSDTIEVIGNIYENPELLTNK